jgi:hypothetical protein
VAATIVSANTRGVVFQTAEGNEALYCSGLPERLTFDEIPGDLKREPQLSIRLAAGEPGPRQVRVSYLAFGFGWQANYVAQLGERMDLLGWITLENFTGTNFRDTEVQVVAGKLNLLSAEDDRGTGLLGATEGAGPDEYVEEDRDLLMEEMREDLEEEPDDVEYFYGCYPMGSPRRTRPAQTTVDSILAQDVGRYPGGEELDEVVVTGFRRSMAVRENLADYQMYRLPEKTDLLARQSKQVAFLHKPEAKYERFYSMRFDSSYDYEHHPEDPRLAVVKIGWVNRESEGLGEPLPNGRVRFFEHGATGLVFTGDDRMGDTAVGAPSEFVLGLANDLAIDCTDVTSLEDSESGPGFMALLTRRAYFPLEMRITNAKNVPVTFEVRQGPIEEIDDFRVKGANRPTQRKAGDYMWRFTVPANGDATLSYRIGGRLPDDD